MNEVPVQRTCLYCEAAAAETEYGLCQACDRIKGIRRVYRLGRGRTPEWEAHLLYLAERAMRRLPLFVPGYETPHRPCRGARKSWRRAFIPRVCHVAVPPKELEE